MRQPLSIYLRFGIKMAVLFLHKVQRRLFRKFADKNEDVKTPKEARHRVDANALKSAFEELGLAPGDSVLVHSGISKLGKIIGGPKLVFELIQEMVGSHGNVLYPVFPFGGLMYEHLSTNPAFDAKTSPSKMGALTEYALNVPGGQRSIHPSHSVVAFGEKNQYFVGEHQYCDTPFADKSPFARLAQVSGKILLIGVGLSSTTSFHRIEDRLGAEFPVRVYMDKIFSVSCIDEEGREFLVKTLSHDPFISRIRDCNLVRDIFLKKGILREVPVGNGTVGIIDAKAMDECLEDLCRNEHFTIYGKIWG